MTTLRRALARALSIIGLWLTDLSEWADPDMAAVKDLLGSMEPAQLTAEQIQRVAEGIAKGRQAEHRNGHKEPPI